MHTETSSRKTCSLCILDLDNTLWDWVEMWGAMFRAKLDEVVRISGIPQSVLIPEFKEIHQRHGTTEYPFAIEELPSLRAKHPDGDLKGTYDSAMHAYYGARKRALKLYPSVLETLTSISGSGCKLVAYTESMAFYSASRLIQLGLDEMFEYMYSPEDHALPRNMKPDEVRRYPRSYYTLRKTQQRFTPPGELKPNPHILRTILREMNSAPDDAIYVGDSKMKDIAMANAVGVTSVWAEYGTAQHTDQYQLLRAVTHWSAQDVERERRIADGEGLSEADLTPKHSIDKFSDLLTLFDFVPPRDS